ncbi:MAG: phenylalanine--tRNA ligase subunit beta [Leptolyngbyaceae cyanobacterium CSU_1_4]|nr:phenylalanine--tRNA ligase subunit beta [Leptolyngbyaceae cyanobacterium CSU_1_4]
MPTISFSLEYLQRLTPVTPQQLEQQAFNYGLEATLHPHTLEVEVTADRPDLLAAEGFARAVNIYNGSERSLPEALEDSGRIVRVDASVRSLRPFIGALIVEQVELGEAGLEALIQFQEKITQTFGRHRKKIAVGVYDLSAITGTLEYTAAHKDALSFIPIHSNAALTAREILAHHPTGKLYAHTLPEGDFVPVLRDSTNQVLSMPPIINANGVGNVTSQARSLFIDVTGTSAKAVTEVVNILAHNFLDCGAQVKTVTIESADGNKVTPDLQPKAIAFSARFLNEMIGTNIAKKDLHTYLSRMGLETTGTNVILVPTYRTDIFSQIDIAGDLMVAVGLDQLKADLGVIRFHTGTADSLKDLSHTVGDWAQRMGLMEVKSFILTDPEILTLFSPHAIQTENAKSRSYSAARTTLQAGLLEILSHNISAPKPLNLYEIGIWFSFRFFVDFVRDRLAAARADSTQSTTCARSLKMSSGSE